MRSLIPLFRCPTLITSEVEHEAGLTGLLSLLRAYYLVSAHQILRCDAALQPPHLLFVCQDELEEVDLENEGVRGALENVVGGEAASAEGEAALLESLVSAAKLVLGICVHSERKQEFVRSIMDIESVDAKHDLMHMIEEIREEWGTEPPFLASDDAETASTAATPQGSATRRSASGTRRSATSGAGVGSGSSSRWSGREDAASEAAHSSGKAAGGVTSSPTPRRSDRRSPASLTFSPVHSPRDSPATRAEDGEEDDEGRLSRRLELLSKENDTLREDLEKAERELAALRDEDAFSDTSTPRRTKDRKQALKSEIDEILAGQQREESLRNELTAAEDRIRGLTAEAERAAAATAEVARLRDEIDVLRPVVTEKAKAEATIKRYRSKLEALSDVSDQLKEVQLENSRLLESNVRLEEQVGTIPVMRQQLEEYKDNMVAAEVRVSELEARIAEGQEEAHHLMEQCGELRSAQAAGAYDADLKAGALAALADGDTAAVDAGVGEGVTEFNPAVAERLARLQAENASLKASLSREASSHVTGLEKSLDDTRRLKGMFEQKYHTSAKRAADLDDALSTARATISQQEGALAAATEQIGGLEGSLSDMTERCDDAIARGDKLQQELDALKGELAQKQAAWAESESSLREEIESVQQAAQRAQEAAEAAAEDAAAVHAKELEELGVSHDEAVERLTEQHNAERDECHARIAELEAELQRSREEAQNALESATSTAAEQAAVASKVEQQLRAELSDYKEQFGVSNAEHEEQVLQLREEMKAFQEQHSVSNEEHERELCELRDELSSWKEAHGVSNEEHAAEVESLRGNIATLEKELAEFKSAHSVSNTEHAEEVAKFEALITQGRGKIRELRGRIEAAKQETVAAEMATAKERETKNVLQSRLDTAEQKATLLTKQVQHLQHEEAKLRKAAETRDTQESELGVELKRVTEEYRKQCESLRRAKKTIEMLQRTNQKYRDRAGASSPETATSPEDMGGAAPRRSTRVAKRAASGGDDAKSLRGGARRVTRASTRLLGDNGDTDSYVESLRQLNHEIDTLKEENSTLVIMQAEETSKRHRVEQDNATLREEYERFKSENVRLKLQLLRFEETGSSAHAEGGDSVSSPLPTRGTGSKENGSNKSGTKKFGALSPPAAAAAAASKSRRAAKARMKPLAEVSAGRGNAAVDDAVDDEPGDDDFVPASVAFEGLGESSAASAVSRRTSFAGISRAAPRGSTARRTSVYAASRAAKLASMRATEAKVAAGGDQAQECKTQ